MLKERLITAVVLVPLVLAAMFYLPNFYFFILVLLVTFIAAWEWASLFNCHPVKRLTIILAPLLICLLFWKLFYYVWLHAGWEVVLFDLVVGMLVLLGVTLWLAMPYFLWRYQKTGKFPPGNFALGLVIFASFATAVFLTPRRELIFLIIIVWLSDIGAYFAGRFFGKHLLASKISPKKTVEGLIGGITTAIIGGVIFNLCVYTGRTFIEILILSVIIAVFTAIGDLFESMLKREAGVKDSGKLLPGHGGMYDRIDGLIAAAPAFLLYNYLILVAKIPII